MDKVKNGLFVSIDYKGSLENGQVFDTSQGRQPLEIKMGAGQLIKGFEKELLGMAVNDKKIFTVDPEDAYGTRNENLIQSFARSDVPPELKPRTGKTVGVKTPNGSQVPARITHVDDEKLTVDMNHPLAGESLTFEIEVTGISGNPTQSPTGCGPGCIGSPICQC